MTSKWVVLDPCGIDNKKTNKKTSIMSVIVVRYMEMVLWDTAMEPSK